MSVRISAAVWSIKGLKAPERIVLLAIADHADDDGHCWPSMVLLADKCEMTDRGVRGVIRRLEQAGYLTTSVSHGRSSNRYTVNSIPEGRSALNSERGSALNSPNPERGTRNEVPCCKSNTEQERLNPERECIQPGTNVPPNHQEPSIEPSGGERVRASRLPSDWKLPKRWGEWAAESGVPEKRIRFEAEKFRDYWLAKAGKDAAKRDWFATWRNWIRRVLDDIERTTVKKSNATDIDQLQRSFGGRA